MGTATEIREDGALIDAGARALKHHEEEAKKLLNHISSFIKGEYGGRCSTWEPDCPVCKLWFAYDQIKGVIDEAE